MKKNGIAEERSRNSSDFEDNKIKFALVAC